MTLDCRKLRNGRSRVITLSGPEWAAKSRAQRPDPSPNRPNITKKYAGVKIAGFFSALCPKTGTGFRLFCELQNAALSGILCPERDESHVQLNSPVQHQQGHTAARLTLPANCLIRRVKLGRRVNAGRARQYCSLT